MDSFIWIDLIWSTILGALSLVFNQFEHIILFGLLIALVAIFLWLAYKHIVGVWK